MTRRTVSIAQAKQLAVRYDAFNEAVRLDNPNKIIVWGRMLLETQDAIHIEMCPPHSIRCAMERATAKELAA